MLFDKPMAEHLEKPTAEHLEKPLVENIEVDSENDLPTIDEKKLLRKIDFRIIPLFTILYLLSFLDRGNIGNAKIEGLAEDLHLEGTQYNVALTIFFVFYALMEIPCNIILKHVKPRHFIPVTMILWSVVMTLMGTVKNYHQLLATRALLGIFEAALFPGISYILSMYYKKNEVLVREAIFFSAASMAGAFSGLLAAAISQMDGVGGYEGWRWIFILEGLLTFLFAIVAWVYFPLYPAESTFLTPEERAFVVNRVQFSSNADGLRVVKGQEAIPAEDVTRNHGEDNSNDRRYIWAVFKDWQSWCMLMVYYGVCVPLYGISLFTPTIIKSLGYTSTKAQLMTAPIFIVAAIFSIVQAVCSDRVGLRSPFLFFNFTCIMVGYLVALCLDPTKKPSAIYGCLYLLALGIYPGFPLIVIWFSNNLAGSYKRAVGMAFQIGIGNFSGAFASNFYRTQDLPRFILGHALELGFISMGMIFMVIVVFGYTLANKRKKSDLAKGVYDGYSQEDFQRMGDKSPHFLYRL